MRLKVIFLLVLLSSVDWFSHLYNNPQLSSILFILLIQCVLYRSFENNVNSIIYKQ